MKPETRARMAAMRRAASARPGIDERLRDTRRELVSEAIRIIEARGDDPRVVLDPVGEFLPPWNSSLWVYQLGVLHELVEARPDLFRILDEEYGLGYMYYVESQPAPRVSLLGVEPGVHEDPGDFFEEMAAREARAKAAS